MARTKEEFDAVKNMVNNMSDAEIKQCVKQHFGRSLQGALGDYQQDCIRKRLEEIDYREYLNRKEEADKDPMSRIYGPGLGFYSPAKGPYEK